MGPGVAAGTQQRLRVTVTSTARGQSDFHNRDITASQSLSVVLSGHGNESVITTRDWLRQLIADRNLPTDKQRRAQGLGAGGALYWVATDQLNQQSAEQFGITVERRPSIALLADNGTAFSIDVIRSPLRTAGPTYRDRRRFMAQMAASAAALEFMVLEIITNKNAVTGIRTMSESPSDVSVTPSNAASVVPTLALPDVDRNDIRTAARGFKVRSVTGTVNLSKISRSVFRSVFAGRRRPHRPGSESRDSRGR
jgi:hypothetical protein